MLSGLFRLAEAVWPARWLPGLTPAALVAAAGVMPSPAAQEGLARLMAALAKDTRLSLFGHLSVRWDMVRLLRNAAQVQWAHEDNPALAAAPVVAPVFILGLPRSGTTFLHTLMAADPANLVPRNWQTIYPRPRPADFDATRDRGAKLVDRQLRMFARMAPGFAALHPITADSPQECSEITAHVFESLRFDTTFRVPDYLAWLDAHGDLAGFEFHRRFLQFLQDGLAGTWVLKCPDHTFSLDVILKVYPDARFVIVHRDPLDVFGSVAVLTEVLRRPFLRDVDVAEIGAQVSSRWVEGTRRLMQFDERAEVAPARKFHVRYETLTGDPLMVVKAIYQQFGMVLTPAAQAAMAQALAARPRGGYAKHAPYAVQRFDVEPEWLGEQFADYVAAYCG